MAAACALAMFSGKMFLTRLNTTSIEALIPAVRGLPVVCASADAPNCVFHEFTL